MSELLTSGLEPLPYSPHRYLELVHRIYNDPSEDLTDDYKKLLDDSEIQLQSDVAALRQQLPVSFEGLLSQDDYTAAWHMAHWDEHGFAHGGFGRPRADHETQRIGQEANEYLRHKIKETAEANEWRAFFKDRDYSFLGTLMPGDLTWRMEQPTYIFDGEHFALIAPTLFQMEDGSVLGDSHIMNGLGPSHLRKHAEVRSVVPVDGDIIDDHALRKNPFCLSSGIPEGLPTEKELAFLERVLAAYY